MVAIRIRAPSILSLPVDILRSIFDHFEDWEDWDPKKDRVKWRYRPYCGDEPRCNQTIQDARLVCRLFNQVASPLLCRIIQVRLNHASINRLKGISTNPLLAAGVRGIQVILDYRPRELSTDLLRYKDQGKKDIQRVYDCCDYHAEPCTFGVFEFDYDEEPGREYYDAMDYYSSVRLAWDDRISSAESNVKDEDRLEFQKFLHKSHEEYRRKHEEQLQLIMDGSFVNIIALSMSRMPNCYFMHFVDIMEDYLYPYVDEPTLLLNNIEEFAPVMTSPPDWRAVERLQGVTELVPAKLLSELPIAINNAGVILKEINITAFPLLTNYSVICPNHDDLLNPAWPALREACRYIEKFEFGTGGLYNALARYNNHAAEEQISINNYFHAMLSSQNLKTVRLNLGRYTLDEDGGSKRTGWFHIGSVLATINWPQIRCVRLQEVSINQDELEKFCNGLGNGLRELSLSGVHLLTGSWVGVLDILREKISSSSLITTCRLIFQSFSSGEFGMMREGEESYKQNSLIIRSQNYVLGLEIEDPLIVGPGYVD
ncbi:hypothetical protein F5884DRAFT_898498 [Xylogone sp. PMI_703]|nr:hypothetical protein F5884DRAFT_898498 [Xylogone sp. PMI_703]